MRAIFKQLCDDKNGFSPEQPKISFHPLLEWLLRWLCSLQRRLSWTRWRRFFRTTCALHTAVPLSLTTGSLKKPSPVGMSTTHGRFPHRTSTGESEAVALQYLCRRIQFPHRTAYRSTTPPQRFGRSKGRCWREVGGTGGGRSSAGIRGHLRYRCMALFQAWEFFRTTAPVGRTLSGVE